MNKFVEEASSDQILEEILKSLNLISTENTKPLIEQISKKLEGIKTQEESKESTEKIVKMRSSIDTLKRDNYELRKRVREGEEEFLRMVPTPNMQDLQSRGVSGLKTNLFRMRAQKWPNSCLKRCLFMRRIIRH